MVKKINAFIILVLILLVFGSTIYKVIKRHNERLYEVLYSKIEYQAKKCFLEEKCEKEIILNDLYNKGYLEIQYDPISKEELNKNIKIEITGEEVIIKHIA